MANLKNNLGLLIIIFCTLSACQEAQFDTSKLHGTWKVNSWKVESSGQTINNKMDMTFESDGTYDIDYGSASEEGKYWISGSILHTVETGKTEKTVKLLKLVSDSLEFQMNRAGQLENVLLLK